MKGRGRWSTSDSNKGAKCKFEGGDSNELLSDLSAKAAERQWQLPTAVKSDGVEVLSLESPEKETEEEKRDWVP